MTVYRTEYWEDRTGKWVAIHEGNNRDEALKKMDTPIIGNPIVRVAEYKKTGVRKIKLTLVDEISIRY